MPSNAKFISPDAVNVFPAKKVSDKEVIIPEVVQSKLNSFLTADIGLDPLTAVSMIRFIAARRAEYCPLLSDIKVGQIVWLALSISKHKPKHLQFARRIVLPVILTIYTNDEFNKSINSLEDLNQLNMEQCARVLVETQEEPTNIVLLFSLFFI